MGDAPEFSGFSVASADFVALEASGGEPVINGGWRDLEVLRGLVDRQKLGGHSVFPFERFDECYRVGRFLIAAVPS